MFVKMCLITMEKQGLMKVVWNLKRLPLLKLIEVMREDTEIEEEVKAAKNQEEILEIIEGEENVNAFTS